MATVIPSMRRKRVSPLGSAFFDNGLGLADRTTPLFRLLTCDGVQPGLLTGVDLMYLAH